MGNEPHRLFFTAGKHRFALFFIVIFISLSFVCSVFFFLFYVQQERVILERIKSKQSIVLTECKDKFEQELESTLKNFLLLCQLPALKQYVAYPDDKNKTILEKEFLTIARINGVYGQIRFIGKNGRELIRIHKEDGQYIIVKNDDLQDKSSRYYFKDIMKFPKGEIYISPFDLNIEHGKIDPTNQITMRIAICAYDRKGNKDGVFIVNYYVKDKIKALYDENCFIIQDHPGKPLGFLAYDGLREDLTFGNINLKNLYAGMIKKGSGDRKISQFVFRGALVSYSNYVPYEDFLRTPSLERFGMHLSPSNRKLEDFVILNIRSNVFDAEELKNLKKSLLSLFLATFALLAAISFFVAKLTVKYYQSVSELLEERDRLNLATQSTKSRVWAFFPKGCIFWISGTYKHKESAGEILLDSINEKYKNEFMDFISGKSMAGDKISEFEFEVVSSDGRAWKLARGFVAEREKSGNPLKITGTMIDITSKKENELILKTFEAAVSSASIGMLLLKAEENNSFSVMYMNGEAEKSLQPSREDYLNSSFERYLLDINLSQEQIKDILTEIGSGRSYKGELKIASPDGGRSSWLQVSLEPLGDSARKKFIWLQYDISSLKEAEFIQARGKDELEEQVRNRTLELNNANSKLELYLKALDYAVNGIVITDVSGKVAWCNQAMELLTGYSKDEIIGNTPRIFKSGKHDEAFYKNIWSTIERGDFWNGEIINRKKNGELYIEEMTAAPVFDSNGKITNYVAIKRDVSEKKANEKKFMAQAAFMRNNPAPVFKVDYKNRKVIECNPAYEELFGRNTIGIDIDKLLPGLLDNSLDAPDAFSKFEFKIEDRHFLFAVAKVEQQEALYIYGSDITNLKNLQVQQKALNGQLMASLKSFQEINFELQIANQHRTQFLSSMNHELRTPLNAIIGFTNMLHQQFFGKLNDKQLEYVEQIEDSGKHLLDLINDLLDMAKVDAGKMTLSLGACSISEFVQPVLKMLELQIQKKKHTIKVDIPDSSLPYIYCDIRRSKQIVLNLLSNAVKYTPEGGNISLKANFLEKEKEVQIDIVDDGPGVPGDEKDNIFSEFYQLENVRDENIGGTGIGLALTKRLVELQGGRIWLEDAEGGGSRFSFTLPVSGEEVGNRTEQKASSPDLIFDASGKKILVAEDNEVNINLIRDMLLLTRCEMILAKDGKEAVDLAVEHHPDLILMDIRMSVMDGLEATSLLRKKPEFSDTPIIAVTASTGTEMQDMQIKAGCTDHLPKPVQINQIFDILRKYL